jgi:hypothetical protein
MISKMTITGAIPRTAGLHCRRVVPVERERERQPVRERVYQWWTVTTLETRPVVDGGTGCARRRERERERERERTGSYPFI